MGVLRVAREYYRISFAFVPRAVAAVLQVARENQRLNFIIVRIVLTAATVISGKLWQKTQILVKFNKIYMLGR